MRQNKFAGGSKKQNTPQVDKGVGVKHLCSYGHKGASTNDHKCGSAPHYHILKSYFSEAEVNKILFLRCFCTEPKFLLFWNQYFTHNGGQKDTKKVGEIYSFRKLWRKFWKVYVTLYILSFSLTA